MKKKHLQLKLFNIIATALLVFGNVVPTVSVLAETTVSSSGQAVEQREPVKEMETDTKTSEDSSTSASTTTVGKSTVTSTSVTVADTSSKASTELPTSKTTEASSKEEKKKTDATKSSTTEKKVKKTKAIETKKLTILGTSDVHGNVYGYSYEDNKDADFGFAQIGTIVKNVKAETPNVILVDAGDNLQGTLMTDDLYSSDPELTKTGHPVISAMNAIGYDSMSLGNHEFNFGLDLIKEAEKQASFPLLSANTRVKATGNHFVKPYKIVEIDGIKVGILGLTIPHVPMWDGEKVSSLEFASLRKEAKKQVTIMQETEKTDVIVAAIHAGLKNSDPEAAAENVITEVPGIDAFVLGHDHREFAEKIKDESGKEKPVGAVKDTGSGVVRLDLVISKETAEKPVVKKEKTTSVDTTSKETEQKSTDTKTETDGKWVVTDSTASIISAKGVAPDSAVRAATEVAHKKTIEYVAEVIGQATDDFLPPAEIPGIPEAQIRPTAMISLINNVQMKVTGADIAAGALFRADSDLKKGDITFADVFNIYKYPNTLVGANLTGKQLKAYMEKQARYYQQYETGDVSIAFNPKIRVYNYDTFSGVKYKIDISKPEGNRIVDLTFKGKEVTDDQKLTIAINNYRFEGLVKDGFVDPVPFYESDPATLRGEIVKYIRDDRGGVIDPEVEIEDSFEIIGADLNHPLRDFVISEVKAGRIKIEDSADGRTPNVKKLNINQLIAEGKIPEELLGFKFSIMHTNDMHGRLEADKNVLGMAKLKTYKDQINPTLMLDGGDSVQGLASSNFSEGMDMASVMADIPYDAVGVGNHEFDFGYDRAMAYKGILPMVSANVIKDGKSSFDPYKIVEKDGKKFAVIGLSTPETAFKTHPKNVVGVTFEDPIPVAKKYVTELKDQVDAIIFIAHLGIDATTPAEWRSNTLAKELSTSYPDQPIVIIDGHSHTPIAEGLKFGNVLLAQTGNYLNNVGIVDVEIATDGSATMSSKLVPTSELEGLAENPAIAKKVEGILAKFDDVMGELVLEDNPVFFQGDGAFGRTRETNLGNIIGDALYNYGQTGFSKQTDFAIINGGGVRTSIEKGKVSKADILAVLPFGNTISQIEVTGQQIYEMFEYSLRSDAQLDADGKVILDSKGLPMLGRNGGFLQVSSSINIIYDSNLQGANPVTGTLGERILRIQLLNRKTNQFEDVALDGVYNVATNDFLAAGGDGYTMLGGAREEGPSLDQVFTEFLQDIATPKTAKIVPFAAAKYQLTDYEEEFPYSRIVPMTQADFDGMLAEPLVSAIAKLKETYAKAEKLKEADYTKETWAAFAKEKETAKAMLASIDQGNTLVTAEEVLTVEANLRTTMGALAVIVGPGASTGTSTGTTGTTTTTTTTTTSSTNGGKKPVTPSKDKLPSTGEQLYSGAVYGVIISLAAGYFLQRRKRAAGDYLDF